MDAARRSSPDDCSDNDALSAPSEFLAEFLSAIMRRQHAEALKYCRLILQYEPHNATARGFYPLLRHKVRALQQTEAGGAGAAGAGGSSSGSSYSPRRSRSSALSADDSRSPHEMSGAGLAQRALAAGARSRSGSSGSVASQSSLELDSSSGSAGASDSGSASRRSASRSEPDSSDARDDNGNVPSTNLPRSDDVENDNDVSHIKSESASSLRRLRAQFACSIK